VIVESDVPIPSTSQQNQVIEAKGTNSQGWRKDSTEGRGEVKGGEYFVFRQA
jgi:hypothetical protein